MKQAILVRMDLKMPKGKLATQVAHAAVDAVVNSERNMVEDWLASGAKKVVLKVADKQELVRYIKQAKEAGLINSLITDAGRTFFDKPTMTCGALGPDKEEKIDKIVGHLKLV